jgi:hypothetical protein
MKGNTAKPRKLAPPKGTLKERTFHKIRIDPNVPKLVSLETFSKVTETPIRTVRDMMQRRVIPFVQIRKYIRIPVEEAMAALSQYKVESVSVGAKHETPIN